MKKSKTLTSYMRDNIGQVCIEDADKEVSRLNNQENSTQWRMDSSDFLYCPDETSSLVSNPCRLEKGYVWITKTPKFKRTKTQKLTKTGYRISKNGAIINGVESNSFVSSHYLGQSTKQGGTYYFFNRKQGNTFIYLP